MDSTSLFAFSLSDLLMNGLLIVLIPGLLEVCELVIGVVTSNFNELIANSAVQSYFSFLEIFAAFLFVAGIGFAISEWAINTNEGNGDSILSTFKYIILGLFATLGFTKIPVLLMQFTAECTGLFIDEMTGFSEIAENMINNIKEGNNTTGAGLLSIIFCIVFIVCVFKVFFGNLKRGGILIIQLTACPFHIFNIPRAHVDAFFSWCKQIIALLLTTFVQNFLLALALMTLGLGSGLTVTNMCLCIGVLLASSEAPQVLQQFGLDSSVKANASQAIFAFSGITNIIRSFAA